MVRARWMMFFILTTSSCGLKELSVVSDSLKDGVWISPETTSGISSAVITTAFSYPDSYDWHKSDATDAKASLVVFMGSDPLMRLAVGDGYQISPEPDRHRFIEGHLYTDYSSDGTMVIKCDGNLMFTYKADERIVGMVVENNHIYTLGIASSGQGFSYRRDGEPVISKHTGRLFQRLEKEDGRICFAYTRKVISDDGESETYHIVRDGVDEQVIFPEHIDEVWDMMSCDGDACCIVSSSLTGRSYLYRNGVLKLLDMPASSRILWARFVSGSSDAVCVEGLYESGNGITTNVLWMNGNEYCVIGGHFRIAYTCSSPAGLSCVANPVSDGSQGMIMNSGEFFVMPRGYCCIGTSPIVMDDGTLVVGLSSIERGRPILWRDGKTDTLSINGYVCSSVLWRP